MLLILIIYLAKEMLVIYFPRLIQELLRSILLLRSLRI